MAAVDARLRSALSGAILLGTALVLSRCELAVKLDVEEVEAGPVPCAICTSFDGGEEDGAVGAEDGAIDGGGGDATLSEGGSTDAGPDATSDAAGGDGAAHDGAGD